MSYSEYIHIYNEGKNCTVFNEVAEVCKDLYQPDLEGGYWDDDKENIFDFIAKTLESETRDKRFPVFHFCNHDGDNDEEVHRCHFIYCEILNAVTGWVICLTSQHTDLSYMWNEDNIYFIQQTKRDEVFELVRDYNEKYKKLKELEKYNNLDKNDVKNILDLDKKNGKS